MNNPENDAFYEQRFLDIRDAVKRGDTDAAAQLTVATAVESEFTGPDAHDQAYRALNAAAVRLGLSSSN